MTVETWIDWCEKQLGDLSRRLYRQGYNPAKIQYLNQTLPEFREQFQSFLDRINRIMDDMAANPDGYHHFEDFSSTKMELLRFTNLNRERFLDLNLAQTA